MPCVIPIALTVALGSPAPSPQPGPGPAPDLAAETRTEARLQTLLLDVDPTLRPALVDALSLRLRGVDIEDFAEAGSAGDGMHRAYLRIRGPTDAIYRVSIVMSDGRAYEREVAAPQAMAGRILGSELALLLRGIEEGTVQPDRDDAVIPPAGEAEERTESKTPQTPATHDEEGTDPNEPTPNDTGPPDLELGIRATLGALVGVAPASDVRDSVAVAGGVGFDLRWPAGATISAQLRVGGSRSPPFSLVRTRIAVGGGYVLRRGAFEMPALALVGIEPWGVRSDGRGTPVHPVTGSARQVPLFGLAARVAPGVRVSIEGRPSVRMRIGPFLEVSGSAAFSDGAGVPRLQDAGTGEVVARLGGLELAAGLSVQAWLALRRGSAREPTP